MVEAPGQKSHFVAPFGVDARRQIARAPALYTALQRLQPQRQPPHHGVSAQRHGQADQRQHPAKTEAKREPVPGIAGRHWRARQQQAQGLAVGGDEIELNVFAALAVGPGLGAPDDFAGGIVDQHFADGQLRRVGA